MLIGMILFIAWIALEAVVVVGSIIWSVENGDWKNIEAAKYDMLKDIEPQDWPGRKPLPPREPRRPKVQQAGGSVKA
jgi:hypothetical protein